MGGMTRAVADGLPKERIEISAARRQARIDRQEDVIVGVNRYRVEEEDPIDARRIDNADVRRRQIARIEQVRAARDADACVAALEALEAGARADGNTLALAIDAARARATLGEISDAMERAFGGRHRAETRVIRGVFRAAYGEDSGFRDLEADIAAFGREAGAAPKLLLAKMGQDGHGPRRQGHRHRLRRPRLRCRHGRPVRDPRGDRAPGHRDGRRRHRRLLPRRAAT